MSVLGHGDLSLLHRPPQASKQASDKITQTQDTSSVASIGNRQTGQLHHQYSHFQNRVVLRGSLQPYFIHIYKLNSFAKEL